MSRFPLWTFLVSFLQLKKLGNKHKTLCFLNPYRASSTFFENFEAKAPGWPKKNPLN
jgi:hypothetical protein